MQNKDNPEPTEQTPTGSPTPATAEKVGTSEHMIPKSRLDEVIQQRNAKDTLNEELQAKLDAFEKTKADDETAMLTAQSKFEDLYNAEKTKHEASVSALAEKEAAIVALETKRIEDMRDNSILQLLNNAHDPNMVLTLLKANHSDSVIALIENNEFKSEAATKLISEFASANTYLFKSLVQGSPSNSGGRMPSVKIDEVVRKEINSKFGKL